MKLIDRTGRILEDMSERLNAYVSDLERYQDDAWEDGNLQHRFEPITQAIGKARLLESMIDALLEGVGHLEQQGVGKGDVATQDAEMPLDWYTANEAARELEQHTILGGQVASAYCASDDEGK